MEAPGQLPSLPSPKSGAVQSRYHLSTILHYCQWHKNKTTRTNFYEIEIVIYMKWEENIEWETLL